MRKLAAALAQRGYQVSHQWVAEALRALNYSLQANRKTQEGGDHPDRAAQFAHISRRSAAYLHAGDPVISVDTNRTYAVGALCAISCVELAPIWAASQAWFGVQTLNCVSPNQEEGVGRQLQEWRAGMASSRSAGACSSA